MVTSERDDRTAPRSDAENGEPQGFDPRDTDHPTGSKRAAENDESESPA